MEDVLVGNNVGHQPNPLALPHHIGVGDQDWSGDESFQSSDSSEDSERKDLGGLNK